ncbi:glycosyltransferase [Thiolapillus sp.]
MLKGENIICFAKDWSEDPTSNNHVMRLLARNNKVLWINSLAMRTPSLASGKDLGKIVNKLKSFMGGVTQVEPTLWVYTPIVLPFPYSRSAVWINQFILKLTLRLLRLKLRMGRFQLWTFLPTSSVYVGKLGEDLSVYYCTDEFSKFSYLDSARIAEMEQEMLEKVDLVFATAHSLLESKKRHNANAFLASHGVDYEHFRRALDEDVELPADVAEIKQPILGFFGLIHNWIDIELLAWLAEQRPEWCVVIIGQANISVSRLERLPNVRLLGRKPYEELPGYCKAFSVGLIPFVINDLTAHVNPIKLREYLSAGLPVVSTPLPEVRFYDHLCSVVDSREAFLSACDAAIREDTPEARIRRSKAMSGETWEQKVEEIGKHIMDVRGT